MAPAPVVAPPSALTTNGAGHGADGPEDSRVFAEYAKWSGGLKGADVDGSRHFLAEQSGLNLPTSFTDFTPAQVNAFADWLRDENRSMAKLRSAYKVAQAA